MSPKKSPVLISHAQTLFYIQGSRCPDVL